MKLVHTEQYIYHLQKFYPALCLAKTSRKAILLCLL